MGWWSESASVILSLHGLEKKFTSCARDYTCGTLQSEIFIQKAIKINQNIYNTRNSFKKISCTTNYIKYKVTILQLTDIFIW